MIMKAVEELQDVEISIMDNAPSKLNIQGNEEA